MKKKATIAIIILVVGVALLASLASLAYGGGVHITKKFSGPSTLAAAAAFGDNTMVTSNGRRLVSYNYVTGQTTNLSPDLGTDGLNNIANLTVSADHKYIVFHDVAPTAGTALPKQAQQLNLNPIQDYWWLYNVSAQTFTPFDGSTIWAKVYGDKAYNLTYSGENEAVVTHDAATMKQTASMNIIPSNDFFVTTGGFLLQSIDNVVSYTSDGVVYQQVAKDSTVLAVTDDGQHAVGVSGYASSGSNKKLTLTLMDIQDQSSATLASNLAGDPVWLGSGSGMVLYATFKGAATDNTRNYFTYDLGSGKSTAWRFGGGLLPQDQSAVVLQALVGPKAAILSFPNNSYMFVGDHTLHPLHIATN